MASNTGLPIGDSLPIVPRAVHNRPCQREL